VIKTKKCSKCDKEFPATIEYFFRDKQKSDGLCSSCKNCKKAANHNSYQGNREKRLAGTKEWYQKNKEKAAADNREWQRKNKERYEANKKIWSQNNKEKLDRQKKEWKQNNREKINESNSKYRKNNREKISNHLSEYYKKNKEKVSKRNKIYRQENIEKEAVRHKIYREENREQGIKDAQARRARKKNLPATYTAKQWKACKTYFKNACCYCGKKDKLEQDHFIPLTRGGEYTHNNIICACRTCNSSKNNNDPFVWYSQQEFYSSSRERKILKYLSYNKKAKTQQLALL